jgi:chromate transporter
VSEGASTDTQVVVPTVSQLFWGWTQVGVLAFGGVLPYAHHHIVVRKRWLTQADFMAMLSIGQLMPGPNIVNVAIMLGRQVAGLRGALAAAFGILTAPFVIMVALVAGYVHVAEYALVNRAFSAIGAASAGLILGTGIKLARSQPRRAWAYLAIGAAFVCIGVLRLPLVPVMLTLAVLSTIAVWYLARPKP